MQQTGQGKWKKTERESCRAKETKRKRVRKRNKEVNQQFIRRTGSRGEVSGILDESRLVSAHPEEEEEEEENRGQRLTGQRMESLCLKLLLIVHLSQDMSCSFHKTSKSAARTHAV